MKALKKERILKRKSFADKKIESQKMTDIKIERKTVLFALKQNGDSTKTK